MKVRLSRRSETDLEDIGDYIAADSPLAAIRFIRELRAVCEKIGQMPTAYRSRSELLDGLRSCAFRRYAIFFVIRHDEVLILRVVHAARDITPDNFESMGDLE